MVRKGCQGADSKREKICGMAWHGMAWHENSRTPHPDPNSISTKPIRIRSFFLFSLLPVSSFCLLPFAFSFATRALLPQLNSPYCTCTYCRSDVTPSLIQYCAPGMIQSTCWFYIFVLAFQSYLFSSSLFVFRSVVVFFLICLPTYLPTSFHSFVSSVVLYRAVVSE